jgi:cytochrome oxidase assembly protein ShyY1
MGRLSGGQILFLIFIVAGFGVFTSLAIAKWQYERRLKEKKLQAAREKLDRHKPPSPPAGIP